MTTLRAYTNSTHGRGMVSIADAGLKTVAEHEAAVCAPMPRVDGRSIPSNVKMAAATLRVGA